MSAASETRQVAPTLQEWSELFEQGEQLRASAIYCEKQAAAAADPSFYTEYFGLLQLDQQKIAREFETWRTKADRIQSAFEATITPVTEESSPPTFSASALNTYLTQRRDEIDRAVRELNLVLTKNRGSAPGVMQRAFLWAGSYTAAPVPAQPVSYATVTTTERLLFGISSTLKANYPTIQEMEALPETPDTSDVTRSTLIPTYEKVNAYWESNRAAFKASIEALCKSKANATLSCTLIATSKDSISDQLVVHAENQEASTSSLAALTRFLENLKEMQVLFQRTIAALASSSSDLPEDLLESIQSRIEPYEKTSLKLKQLTVQVSALCETYEDRMKRYGEEVAKLKTLAPKPESA